MIGHLHILFAPLLPPLPFAVLACAAAALCLYALFRRVRGALWRGLAFLILLFALANPSLIEEQREPLKDVALLVIDDSASMQINGREDQSTAAQTALEEKLARFNDLDVETLHVKGLEETDLFHGIEQKLSTIPHDRLAGIIVLTDGEIHDRPSLALPTPLHALIAGHRNEFDRRLIIKESPAYGLVDKKASLTLRVEDEPTHNSENASVHFRRDDGTDAPVTMPVGKDVTFDLPITHAGQNLFVFSTDVLPGELTPLNNTVAVTVNGIRDRLRVLLVSGQPHIGGRTWRNFLKADPAVDLVHFTILRSPMKFDMTPNTELSLIAFPVHELFAEKLNSFDLVILDRFRQQSLVPDEYLDNIARYVDQGGALLVSNATDEGIPPLTFSPLARILPAEPTGKLLTGAFKPERTDAGKRHPVTNALEGFDDAGPWLRQIDAHARRGEVLLSGLNGAPLLILDHVGKGRVAQFLSDQFWLWAHNYKGGGPQGELLRRIAHWLVQEPELDEDALHARGDVTDDGLRLVVTRQSLHETTDSVTITDPDGQTSPLTLVGSTHAGILEASMPVTKAGLYTVKDADRSAMAMVGPINAPEFGAMRATEDILSPYVASSGGGLSWLEDHPDGPDIRRVSASSAAHGWNWIGLRQNGQYRITGNKAYPLLPAGLVLAALLAFVMLAWRKEGRG